MIRGAIEVAQRSRVVGWIHSSTESLRGKIVLGFVDGRCVGSGEVSGFRQDLLDARLGDGFCGFDFPVRLSDGERIGSLIVRLQFSDAALLQPASRVIGAMDAESAGGPDIGAMRPGRVAWLMDKGMLGQVEYDFLNALRTTGAYARSLRVGKPGTDLGGQRLAPEMAAAELLGVVMLDEVRVMRTNVACVADIATLAPSAAPVLALWSANRGRISLDEGSHQAGRRAGHAVLGEPPPGGIDHDFGPDRLLFVHRDCRFAARGPAPAAGLAVLTASPAATPAVLEARAA